LGGGGDLGGGAPHKGASSGHSGSSPRRSVKTAINHSNTWCATGVSKSHWPRQRACGSLSLEEEAKIDHKIVGHYGECLLRDIDSCETADRHLSAFKCDAHDELQRAGMTVAPIDMEKMRGGVSKVCCRRAAERRQGVSKGHYTIKGQGALALGTLRCSGI